MRKMTLGVIVGNRDFFPDVRVTEGRRDILAVLGKPGLEGILPGENETNPGAVETWSDAQRSCALTERALPACWWCGRTLAMRRA